MVYLHSPLNPSYQWWRGWLLLHSKSVVIHFYLAEDSAPPPHRWDGINKMASEHPKTKRADLGGEKKNSVMLRLKTYLLVRDVSYNFFQLHSTQHYSANLGGKLGTIRKFTQVPKLKWSRYLLAKNLGIANLKRPGNSEGENETNCSNSLCIISYGDSKSFRDETVKQLWESQCPRGMDHVSNGFCLFPRCANYQHPSQHQKNK